jgi:ABC-type polar amino acid transport system ATPase subunit
MVFPLQLSAGGLQRVAIAVQLSVTEIFSDKTTSNLDQNFLGHYENF